VDLGLSGVIVFCSYYRLVTKCAPHIAKLLKSRLGATAKRVTTRELPNWLVRIAALRDPAIRLILPELGTYENATNEKAKKILGWTPRSNEEAILATAESLLRLGLLKG